MPHRSEHNLLHLSQLLQDFHESYLLMLHVSIFTDVPLMSQKSTSVTEQKVKSTKTVETDIIRISYNNIVKPPKVKFSYLPYLENLKLYGPFLWMRFTSHFEETVQFLHLISQDFLVLI